MPNYRRASLPGGTYFFTVVTFERRPILCKDDVRDALRIAIEDVRRSQPFTIDAWVLLPDHLHCVWTLPEGDANYPQRWARIKRRVSVQCAQRYSRDHATGSSRQMRRERSVWQRRYWEHQIRNSEDFARHIDYIHWNPVKHGYVTRAREWRFSTFHRFVRQGLYPLEWGVDDGSVSHDVHGEP